MGSTEAIALAVSAALCGAESLAAPLFKSDSATTVKVNPAYGAVILVNMIGSAFAVIHLGMRVGRARREFNVPLPQMYAAGDSENAVKFNCVQRGHQQALETYPIFLALSVVGGVKHPITTALAGVLWIHARREWATCYAKSGPNGRYNSKWSRFIWWTLLAVTAASASTALSVMGVLP